MPNKDTMSKVEQRRFGNQRRSRGLHPISVFVHDEGYDFEKVKQDPRLKLEAAKAKKALEKAAKELCVTETFEKNSHWFKMFNSDTTQVERLLKAAEVLSACEGLEAFIEKAEDAAEAKLMDFKRAVKPCRYSAAQYELVQHLNAIEEKVDEYPLVAPKQATLLLGMFSSSNPSRDIGQLVKEKHLMAFSLGRARWCNCLSSSSISRY